MARKFELTEPARRDLLEIWSYIAEYNPATADRTLRAFKEKFQLLADNPKIGQLQDDLIINLRRFVFKDFLFYYFPTDDGIEIYRVLHGSRDIENLFDEQFEGLKP